MPIFKIKLFNGCLLIYNKKYYIWKPYFEKNPYLKDFTFMFFNIEIQYRELTHIDKNCEICLYDSADCIKEIRKGYASEDMIKCHNISTKQYE